MKALVVQRGIHPLVALDRQPSVSLPPELLLKVCGGSDGFALGYATANIAGKFPRLALSVVVGKVAGLQTYSGSAPCSWRSPFLRRCARGVLPSRRLPDLGLVFLIVGAIGMAVREFWQGLPPTDSRWFMVPGECVWLVVSLLPVPNTPRKILVASLLAASMGPAARAIFPAATGARDWCTCRPAE